MKNVWLGLLVVALGIGCSKDNSNELVQPSFLQKPVNTGYYAFDQNGSFIRVVGVPNVIGNTDNINFRPIRTFPNPDWISDNLSSQSTWNVTFNENIGAASKKVWLVEALYGAAEVSVLLENGFTYQEMGGAAVWEVTTTDNFILITLDNAKSNDYRLYVEAEGVIYSDNLARRPQFTY